MKRVTYVLDNYPELSETYRVLPRSLSVGPEARVAARQNHEIARAKALARRNGNPQSVRLAERCAAAAR